MASFVRRGIVGDSDLSTCENLARRLLYRLVMNATTKKNVAPARNHLPCRCCKRYTLSTELVNGSCRDCAGELAAMDSRAQRMLETIGQGEDSY